MLKNIIGVLGTVLMVSSSLMLTACGDNKDNGGNSNNDTEQESTLKKFEGITYSDKTFTYDGIQKELVLSGTLPEGSNVVYTNNVGTNAGVYNATAKITCNGYSELNLSAKMTINKASYDVTETHWNYASPYTYDGNSKSVVLNNLPNGVSISRYINNEKVNAGTYTASAEFDYDKINYNMPAIENCVWVINKADITGITFEGTSVLYDGNFHSIKVNGNIPDGSQISILYNNQNIAGVKDVGTYNVEVTIINPNYNTYTTSTNLVIYQNDIQKSNYDMSGVSWNYTSAFTYDGTEKSVTLNNLPSGVTVKRYIGNTNIDAGTYTASVEFNYDETNYNMPVMESCTWTINKADITGITFNGSTVEYDTKAHKLQLVGNVPSGSKVTITYNGQEVDGVTEVGKYNVVATISNKNYNLYTISAVLTIKSTEEQLYSLNFNGKTYFQNNLDGNRLYVADNGEIRKVNNDIPNYIIANGNTMYYYSSSMFSKVIKSYDGTSASEVIDVNGQYITTDGNFMYYSINNIFNTDENGIYKVNIKGGSSEPTRIVKDKGAYLTYYDGNIYYSNLSDGKKLYKVSVTESELETGKMLFDEKVSYIIEDGGVLYFNSTKSVVGVGVASAIRKYVVKDGTNVKLTTDSGKYLTKVGVYIYYINNDKITSELFGDGIYRISSLLTDDNNKSGEKVLSIEDNGYSSLTSDGNILYYYKLNDKHFYSYNIGSKTETDLMKNFVVQEEVQTPKGYAKLAEYNGEIYYTDTNDNGALYKYNIASGQKFKVLSNQVSNVYFYNNYMYYSTYFTINYALWRMDLNTNESVKISKSRCDNLIFDGDTIYYIKVGSKYDNYIMKMNLDGSNPEVVFKDKSLWVASFEKHNNYLYFTINPIGKKYAYRYNLTDNKFDNLELRSNYITVVGDNIFYYNIDDYTLNCYNINSKSDIVLTSNVNINNMIYSDGYLYYSSTNSKKLGFYKINVNNKTEIKISDKCADGLIASDNKIYYLQTAVSYSNDYPSLSNGDGCLYVYNGNSSIKL